MSTLRYQMVIVWSDKDGCYLVHLPDFPEPTYRAQGKSYAAAAKKGEAVLQHLRRSEPESPGKVEPSAEASPAAISEIAMVPGEPAIQSASRLSGKAIAVRSPNPQTPSSQTPPFPVLRTALTSISTSVVAFAILTALAFVSEGFKLPWQEPSTSASAEKADTAKESQPDARNQSKSAVNSANSDSRSEANNQSELAANSKSDPPKDSKSDATASTAAVPPLALTNSIAESNAVWAIATYSDKSRNINLILSGDEMGRITISDQGSGQPIRTIEAHTDKVRAIAIAPNARRFVSSSGDGIKVWNLETGELLYSLPSSAPVWSIAIAPDESRFISGASDGTLAAWDLKTGQPLYSNHDDAAVWSVAISPDGRSFVSGDSNRAIRQWDLATGQPLRTFTGHQSDVRAVAISPNGKILASGSWDKTIKLWSLETGELKATLEGHRDRVVSLAISSDSSTLASGSTDTTVKLWSLSDYKLLESLDAHSDWVLTTAFKSKERTLITGGKDKTIKIWQ